MRYVVTILCLILAGDAMAYEEPPFDLIERNDDFELRRYDPYLVAETTVAGDYNASGNLAFKRLAGYIFGANDDSLKMQMTVPVTRKPDSDAESYTYQFVMEPHFTLESLPQPNSDEVALRKVPGRLFAVRQYSGRANERNFERALKTLRVALEGKRWRVISAPRSAVYNGPFTLPMFRRNEVMLEVEDSK